MNYQQHFDTWLETRQRARRLFNITCDPTLPKNTGILVHSDGRSSEFNHSIGKDLYWEIAEWIMWSWYLPIPDTTEVRLSVAAYQLTMAGDPNPRLHDFFRAPELKQYLINRGWL